LLADFRDDNPQCYVQSNLYHQNLLIDSIFISFVDNSYLNIQECANLNHHKKKKAAPSQLIPQKLTEKYRFVDCHTPVMMNSSRPLAVDTSGRIFFMWSHCHFSHFHVAWSWEWMLWQNLTQKKQRFFYFW